MNSIKHNRNPHSEGKVVLLFCLLFGSVNDKSTVLNESFGTLIMNMLYVCVNICYIFE